MREHVEPVQSESSDPGESSKPTTDQPGNWNSFQRSIRQHPWLSVAGGLFAAGATATLFGLPSWLAWLWLIWGFALLVIVRAVSVYIGQFCGQAAHKNHRVTEKSTGPRPEPREDGEDTPVADTGSESETTENRDFMDTLLGRWFPELVGGFFGYLIIWLPVFSLVADPFSEQLSAAGRNRLALIVAGVLMLLCVGTGFFIGSRLVRDSISRLEKRNSRWLTVIKFFSFFSLTGLVLIAVVINNKESILTTPTYSGPQQSSMARAAHRYWMTTVHALHEPRFGLPPLPDETPADYNRRRYQLLEEAVQAAEAANSFAIDVDLLIMVRAQLAVDRQELVLLEQAQQYATRQGVGENQIPVEQFWASLDRILANLSTEDLEQLPPEARQLLGDALAMNKVRQEQLWAIKVMQTRLSARYEGQQFPLPELPESTDAAARS